MGMPPPEDLDGLSNAYLKSLVLKLLEEVAARRPFEISHRAGWRVLCCCNQSGHCLRPIDQPSRQVTCPQPEAPAVAG